MSNFTDTLLRFLDILAACAVLGCGFISFVAFVADVRYQNSRAQRLDSFQGRKVTYHWGRYFLASVVAAAWLVARNW